MRKAGYNNTTGSHKAVNLLQLKEMPGCGKQTARIIAYEASAAKRIGRQVLYSVPKIEQYIDKITSHE